MSDTSERPPSLADEAGDGIDTPIELPAHDAFSACPKCGVTLIEHHRVRWHPGVMPYDPGRDNIHQETCTQRTMARVGMPWPEALLGEHLCHLCDVCGYGWVSQIATVPDE